MDLQPITETTISLCAACLAIRASPEDRFETEHTHHSTRESLLKSVNEGCNFCKSLWNTASDAVKNEPKKSIETTATVTEWGKNGYILSFSSSDHYDKLYWSIHLYTQDSVKAVVRGKKIEFEAGKADVPSTFDAEHVKAWIRRCGQNNNIEHYACSPRLDLPYTVPPRRLLDLGEKDSTTFKLIVMDTDDAWDERSNYFTLSHIPVHDPKLTLTEATTSRLLAGCSDADVDDAILRAFQFTRATGTRYMWVPCLCVQQDSEEEIIEYAAHMCDGYLLSGLNLVSSSIPSKPVAEMSDDAFIRLTKDFLLTGSAKDYIAIHDDYWDHNINFLPIWQRPDGFAQRCIPGKLLYFDHWSGQMFFTCRARGGRASSIFPTGIPDIKGDTNLSLHRGVQQCLMQNPVEQDIGSFDPDPLFALFNSASETLSKLVASNQMPMNSSDIPDLASLTLAGGERATASLATSNSFLRHMAPFARLNRIYVPFPYHAGLLHWQKPYNLTWYISNDFFPAANIPASRIISKPPTPSWSWASVPGEHNFACHGNEFGLMSLACSNDPSPTDFLGNLPADATDEERQRFKGAEWNTVGKVVPCRIVMKPEGWVHADFRINGHEARPETYYLYPDVKPGVQTIKECGLLPVVFKFFRGYYNICYCLVVEEAGEERQDGAAERGKAYVRIGFATLEDDLAQEIGELLGLEFSEGAVNVNVEKYDSYTVPLRLV